jgi:hypothetical protein
MLNGNAAKASFSVTIHFLAGGYDAIHLCEAMETIQPRQRLYILDVIVRAVWPMVGWRSSATKSGGRHLAVGGLGGLSR